MSREALIDPTLLDHPVAPRHDQVGKLGPFIGPQAQRH
jgi:hypothetical protein